MAASAFLFAAAAAAAAQIDVWREGDIYQLRASAVLAADPRIAWATLTDHEALPRFIDDIQRSRIVRRDGNDLLVEHVGALRVLWFERPVRLLLRVTEQPYERIRAKNAPGQVDGAEQTLRAFDGSYALTVVSVDRKAGVRLDYRAQLQLTEPLPPILDPLFGRTFVAHAARRHFEALVSEIERRHRRERASQR